LVSLSCCVDAVVAASHSSKLDKASGDKIIFTVEPSPLSLSLSLSILYSNCEFFNFFLKHFFSLLT
jgi:hypothetical protein